jgi:type IV secretory pathway TrbF-like protein
VSSGATASFRATVEGQEGVNLMWLRKKNREEGKPSVSDERLHYSRYYEHDGALRAYANRAMVVALLSVPTTLLAVAFAAYVLIQPPTIIRVDQLGRASLLTETRSPAPPAQDLEPTEFEKRAFLRAFLERYLTFSPSTVRRNWAEGLNMMSANLRRAVFAGIEKNDLIAKIEDDQTSSVFELRSLEASKQDPLTYTAFGVKQVHRLREHNESSEKIVSEFHLRLVIERRSEENPSGLLIAEYWERPIEGEKRDSILERSGSSSF